MRRRSIVGVVALLTALSAGVGAAVAQMGKPEQQVIRISQKHQMFNPNSVTLNRGDELLIVNDDDDLLHHAYIKSDALNFDSGDQEPGDKVVVPFPVAGTFTVLCGIHPKMKLKVTVN